MRFLVLLFLFPPPPPFQISSQEMNLFIASEAAAAAAARPAEVMNHRAWKAGHAFLKMYWKTFKNKFELIDSKVSPAKVIRYAPQKYFL